MYYLDKLLIIFIIIIIILLIINYNNNNKIYEHLENDDNNKSTTLDALNNITNMIKKDKIISNNMELTGKADINEIKINKSNIDNIKGEELLINKLNTNNFILNNNNLTIKNTKIYIGDINIYYVHNNIENNKKVFGILFINNNECILNNCTLLIETKTNSPFYIVNISDGTNTYYPYKTSDYRGGGFVDIGTYHQLDTFYMKGLLSCDETKWYKLKMFYNWNKHDEILFSERKWYYLSFNDVRFKLNQ